LARRSIEEVWSAPRNLFSDGSPTWHGDPLGLLAAFGDVVSRTPVWGATESVTWRGATRAPDGNTTTQPAPN